MVKSLVLMAVWAQTKVNAVSDLAELYIGELEPQRHFWFVANRSGTEDTTLADYLDSVMTRCRDVYGGRLAWFDTQVSLSLQEKVSQSSQSSI